MEETKQTTTLFGLSTTEQKAHVTHKLNELIVLLQSSSLNHQDKEHIRQQFDKAIADMLSSSKNIQAYREMDKEATSREEMLDNLELLLSQHPLDSKLSRKYLHLSRMKYIFQLCMGLAMITLGLSMIFLPAPPYFEMFTIIYFTTDDGFTLMDLISLIIVFCGVYLTINALIKIRALRAS
ncbi:hypothetical protein FW774_07205 [Pedobacter sp. BS3]|uniref:hypothetical protein n=1 Tax=Pedobacter sp. BS3 TaxID=2567937 RepID=UPI0011ECC493|nr:hypothetical protein [Pedobacter sp. BS3]TZF84762.1 hypothetical protein FW774_07205 [Pedobacter sp. BS3]